MKFIEIKDGFSVRKECVVAIVRSSDGGSIVKTEEGQYVSNFSYETMLKLLEMKDIGEVTSKSYVPNMFEGQFWRG